ncbi:MAG TPA: hypothetical protein GXX62_10080 [Alcaligenaceae bacterium]|nr:hypothetical protein [Alcaligenaceae bacterium]
MNALLLSTLTGSAQPGLGSLSNKTEASADSAFAALLGEQIDALDPQLADLLQALRLDPQAQRKWLAQLEQLGLQPDQLNELKALLQAETTAQKKSRAQLDLSDVDQQKNAADFVNATLFIARESSALRQLQADANTLKASLNTDLDDKSRRFSTFASLTEQQADGRSNPSLADRKASSRFSAFANSSDVAQQANAHKADLSAALQTPLNSANPATTSLPEFSLQAALAQSTTGQPGALATAHSAQITTPLHQVNQWSTDFGRVMVQISQQAAQNPGINTAEIRLDPPELGPLRIVLSVTDSIASAMIFAAHAQTRQTVEQALPQLQQQLAQAGLSLGEANVSDQGFSAHTDQQPDKKPSQQAAFSLTGMDQIDENTGLLPARASSQPVDPNAIIDTFA